MAKDKKRKEHEISIRSEEKVNQILEEIKTAQSRNIAPESVLEKISPYLEQEPFLTVHLIEALARIPDPDTAQLLIEMMEKMKEKSIIKSIKKTLYKLKQKGVRWQEKPQKYDPVLKPLKPAEPEGYLGAIDSTGSRVIAITRSLPLRGFMAVISITNDLAGIQEFNLGEFTKKSFKP